MGVAAGSRADGVAVVEAAVKESRVAATPYPAYGHDFVGPVSVSATGRYRLTYDARWFPEDRLPE